MGDRGNAPDFIQRMMWEDNQTRVLPIPALAKPEKIRPRPEPYDPVEGHRKYDSPSVVSLEDDDCVRMLSNGFSFTAFYVPPLKDAQKTWGKLRLPEQLYSVRDVVEQRKTLWLGMDTLHPVLEALLQVERFGKGTRQFDAVVPEVRNGRIEVNIVMRQFAERDTKLYRLLLAHAYHKP